jgi:periplasmic copper chaperone A
VVVNSSRRTPVGLIAAGIAVLVAAAALFWWGTAAGSSKPSGAKLAIINAYVPQPASPDVAAVYFTVTNTGSHPDTLTGVSTDVSTESMMHESVGETMSMVDSLSIPAHGSIKFSPDGYHVMLEKPSRTLRQGDHIQLTLTFGHSAPITVQAPVVPLGYRPDAG